MEAAELVEALTMALSRNSKENGRPKNGSLLVNISKYGAASVIAVFMSWELVQQLPVLLQATQKTQAEVQQIQDGEVQLQDQHKQFMQDSQETKKTMNRLLQTICINLARTKTDRDSCLN